MEEADRTAALKRLEPLVGAWNIETGIPGGEGVVGRMEIEWLLGGAFLAQRSEVPHPAAPDAFCVIAPKDDYAPGEYVQHYFDSRGSSGSTRWPCATASGRCCGTRPTSLR